MGRAPCCDKENVKKGPWSPEEDAKLKDFIDKYGTGGNWIALPHKAGLKRCGKSCRLRWLNYLRPNIKHGEFTEDEDRIITSLYASIGSRWSIIAAQLPGRTDNDIKNYWNTKLKKKLLAMLPSFQKKPSFFSSLSLPPPPPPYRSEQFMTTNSSSFYSYTTPTCSFMNVNNSIDALLTPIADLSPAPAPAPAPAASNSLISLITNTDNNDNCFYLGFQEDYQSIYRSPVEGYHYPTSDAKPGMLMFANGGGGGGGGGGHEVVSTTCSSSEGGSCMSQISYGDYHKDNHQKKQQQQHIKQEDQFTLRGFGDQTQSYIINHNYTSRKPEGYLKNYESPLHNDLEEVKQLIGNNSSSSYLFSDDENKTTHDHKGMCYYY